MLPDEDCSGAAWAPGASGKAALATRVGEGSSARAVSARRRSASRARPAAASHGLRARSAPGKRRSGLNPGLDGAGRSTRSPYLLHFRSVLPSVPKLGSSDTDDNRHEIYAQALDGALRREDEKTLELDGPTFNIPSYGSSKGSRSGKGRILAKVAAPPRSGMIRMTIWTNFPPQRKLSHDMRRDK